MGGPRTYAPETRRKARALYHQGYTPAEAARALKVNYSTLVSWGKAEGYDWPTHKQRTYTAGQRAQALQMARSGYTRREVAEALNILPTTLKYWGQRWRNEGIFDWPQQRGRRPEIKQTEHRSCHRCEDRPRCTQHHCLCEKEMMVEGHPESMTLTYDEAEAHYG